MTEKTITICKDQSINNCYNRWMLYRFGFNFMPKIAIDVGCYRAEWAKQFKYIFSDAKMLLLDANSDHESYVKEFQAQHPTDIFYEFTGVGNSDDTLDFYLPSDTRYATTGSSFNRENTEMFNKYITRQIKCQKLDDIIDKYFPMCESIDYLKLDVQGSESKVLEGAVYTLQKTRMLQMELSVIEYNRNGMMIHEMIHNLHDKYGFVVMDILETSYLPVAGMLAQMDFVFVHENDTRFRPQPPFL